MKNRLRTAAARLIFALTIAAVTFGTAIIAACELFSTPGTF